MRLLRPRAPVPTRIVNCSFLKLTIWPRITLPSFRRIVSARTGKLARNTSAGTTRGRTKNFFIITSSKEAKTFLFIRFACDDMSRGELARRRDKDSDASVNEGLISRPRGIKKRRKLPSLQSNERKFTTTLRGQ